MANTLSKSSSLDIFRSKKVALVGAMLGIAALAACGPKDSGDSNAVPNTAASQGTTTEQPANPEPIDAGNTGMVTSIPQMEEKDLTYTDNNFGGFPDADQSQRYLGGRFGAYYYDVVGAKGACITKFQAELNNQARLDIIAADDEWARLDPANYDEFLGKATLAKKMERPSLALIEAAADDSECPEANNDTVITFEHNGQQLQTAANEMLVFLDGGITRARDEFTQGYPETFPTEEALKDAAQETLGFVKKDIAREDINNSGVVDSEDIISRQISVIPTLIKKQASVTMLERYGYLA